ncbi:MAG: RhuM family protein [Candidatus Woesearchaeota archaeon]
MNSDKVNNNGSIEIYNLENGDAQISVLLEDETVWLTISQMSELFGKAKSTINEHILNIFKEKELNEQECLRKIGNSDYSTKPTNFYNLDVIISAGYRVKSIQGTKFRQWATKRLKEYMIKGFSIDSERLKYNSGGNYFKELLDTIKDIRSSEKVLYRQVLDLYATSVDYDPQSDKSKVFFATIQNKLHYAANGKTAAEIINERADSSKEFMGLMTFSNGGIKQRDTFVAKNYLTEKEIKRLNNIVSAYFDIAELRAMDGVKTTMQDYINQLDKLVQSMDRKILQDSGSISKIEAEKKAQLEYRKYKSKILSPVEEEYLKSLKDIQKDLERKVK